MVDARGYLCPMPVVMVQNAIKKDQPAATVKNAQISLVILYKARGKHLSMLALSRPDAGR